MLRNALRLFLITILFIFLFWMHALNSLVQCIIQKNFQFQFIGGFFNHLELFLMALEQMYCHMWLQQETSECRIYTNQKHLSKYKHVNETFQHVINFLLFVPHWGNKIISSTQSPHRHYLKKKQKVYTPHPKFEPQTISIMQKAGKVYTSSLTWLACPFFFFFLLTTLYYSRLHHNLNITFIFPFLATIAVVNVFCTFCSLHSPPKKIH